MQSLHCVHPEMPNGRVQVCGLPAVASDRLQRTAAGRGLRPRQALIISWQHWRAQLVLILSAPQLSSFQLHQKYMSAVVFSV